MTTNAESFKESYNGFEPDVIVLDVVMPEIDGIELVKYLSTQECGARILVISGYAQRYLDNTKALGGGVWPYVGDGDVETNRTSKTRRVPNAA